MSAKPDDLPDAAQHVHTATVPVRWGDLDAAGHVNNSCFFTYFEEARVNWLGTVLDGPLFTESGPVLANATCDFKQPLTHPATLIIEVYATPPGRSSMKTAYKAMLESSGTVVATGTAVLVWVSVATGEPVPVPDLGLR
ncbi:thioesterase [Salinibacter sp. 10B]|uniref:acyl-CoA thioesterase n=1 Tax=Salinibacter sp. 10B TaxID=1923971 RepID=UPI000CF53C90|nr:thioesterase family protein [Salinibacter sp. 10B]PQJ35694.1 thioesterase [Salinibacter sp. 10B]